MSTERPTFTWKPGEQWPPQAAHDYAAGLPADLLGKRLGELFVDVAGANELISGAEAVGIFAVGLLEDYIGDPAELSPEFVSDAAEAVALRHELVNRLSAVAVGGKA